MTTLGEAGAWPRNASEATHHERFLLDTYAERRAVAEARPSLFARMREWVRAVWMQ